VCVCVCTFLFSMMGYNKKPRHADRHEQTHRHTTEINTQTPQIATLTPSPLAPSTDPRLTQHKKKPSLPQPAPVPPPQVRGDRDTQTHTPNTNHDNQSPRPLLPPLHSPEGHMRGKPRLPPRSVPALHRKRRGEGGVVAAVAVADSVTAVCECVYTCVCVLRGIGGGFR
jgi:hypothetical protein